MMMFAAPAPAAAARSAAAWTAWATGRFGQNIRDGKSDKGGEQECDFHFI